MGVVEYSSIERLPKEDITKLIQILLHIDKDS